MVASADESDWRFPGGLSITRKVLLEEGNETPASRIVRPSDQPSPSQATTPPSNLPSSVHCGSDDCALEKEIVAKRKQTDKKTRMAAKKFEAIKASKRNRQEFVFGSKRGLEFFTMRVEKHLDPA